MLECIITSSMLIIVVIALRFLFREKISQRLQYALWGLVLFRLLMPFSLLGSPLSIMNAVPDSLPLSIQAPDPVSNPIVGTGNGVLPEYAASTHPTSLNFNQILKLVWLIGTLATFLWMFSINFIFYIRLYKTRVPYDSSNCKLPVYISEQITSPCLFGIFRPSIYLTQKAADNAMGIQYVLSHELCHYRHGDHIWLLLRNLCLTVYWFNPLVWIAAILSRIDSELACDEAVIKQIGEENRLAYGHTLLDMIAVKKPQSSIMYATTTIVLNERSIYRRLNMIIKNPKAIIPAVVAVLFAMLICLGCTFTSAKTTSLPPEKALEQLAASIVRTKNQVSFEIPKSFERPHEWNIHIAGRLVTDGFSQSIHLLDELTETRTWKPGERYTIELNDGYTELTLTAFLPDGKGGILEKDIDLLRDSALYNDNRDLNSCISHAIISANENQNRQSDFKTEAHTILKTVENGETTIVYAMALYQEYNFVDGAISDVGGSHIPVAITFLKNSSGEYTLKEYWMPKDGSYYAPSIKEKFPSELYEDALDTQKYILSEVQVCYANAIENFKIDTDHVLQKLIKTISSSPAGASNPGAYVKAHQIEYRELLYYGDYTLRYAYAQFLKGGQTDLQAHILLSAMRELLAGENQNLSVSGTPQKWFDEWKSLVEKQRDCSSIEFFEKNYPKTSILFQMMDQVT